MSSVLGPKQQKAFKNLMLNRIKWGDEIIGQKKEAENKDTPGERNECSLVSKVLNFGYFWDFKLYGVKS